MDTKGGMGLRSVTPDVQALNRARVSKVMTWKELRNGAQIAPGTMTRLLAGRPVTIRIIRAVAAFLEVEPRTLVQMEPDQQGDGHSTVA